MRRLLDEVKRLLMIPPQLITAFWEKADAQGSRSTVLRPLGWLVGLCIVGAVSSGATPNSPVWLTAILGAGVAISVFVYLGAYIFCLIKMPDYLRTEKHSIQKLAIEKGFKGDSLTGIVQVETSSGRLIDSGKVGEEQG